MKNGIIAVDLGGTNIRVGLVENQKLKKTIEKKLENKNDLDNTLLQLSETISSLFNRQVKGIAIGVPSVVDTKKGIVYNVANIPSWTEVHLKSIFEKQFNVPVEVNNDVNCFILGEHHFGAAKGYHSAVGLAIGTGLGAGIIINNLLLEGANAGAGEIGLLPYLQHNLEFYCSGNFFSAFHNMKGKDNYNNAKNNDTKALDIFNEFGKHVAQAIKYTVLAYDPEIIVLGGSIAEAFPFFEKAMNEALTDFPYPNSIKKLTITCAKNPQSHLLGASLLINN